ncbi:MAG TPA: hypothetical protein PLN37_06020, partial [Smithella sp.]|nr:hypothetical protein [Smithella sp.]
MTDSFVIPEWARCLSCRGRHPPSLSYRRRPVSTSVCHTGAGRYPPLSVIPAQAGIQSHNINIQIAPCRI